MSGSPPLVMPTRPSVWLPSNSRQATSESGSITAPVASETLVLSTCLLSARGRATDRAEGPGIARPSGAATTITGERSQVATPSERDTTPPMRSELTDDALRSAVDAAPDGIIVVDEAGTI